MYIANSVLGLLGLAFLLWFLWVVILETWRNVRFDISQGVKYDQQFFITVWHYFKAALWYHFPRL